LKAGIVTVDQIPYVWPAVHPMLGKVVERSEGELSINDIWEAVNSQQMQLWVVVDEGKVIMSMLTQFIHYPQKKILRVISLAGENFKEVHKQFNDMFESFAITNECSALELWGRKGWKKMLPDWKDSYIVFTKDLQERMH